MGEFCHVRLTFYGTVAIRAVGEEGGGLPSSLSLERVTAAEWAEFERA